MWPVPFLTEGLILGVLVAWFRWRCEWPAKLRVAVMLVLCALILIGCAHQPDARGLRTLPEGDVMKTKGSLDGR